MANVFVTYGTTYDMMEKPKKAVKIYSKGIKKFPNFHLLHFNKGITLNGMKEYEKAIPCFEESVRLNPNHITSLNALASMWTIKYNKIPALLIYSRFFILEHDSKRAKANFEYIPNLIDDHVKKGQGNSVSITLSSGGLEGSKKLKHADFSIEEMTMMFSLALKITDSDNDSLPPDTVIENPTDIDEFVKNFEYIMNSLNDELNEKNGIYWDIYIPYFKELVEKKHTYALAYLIYSNADEKELKAQIEGKEKEIEQLKSWSKSYQFDK